MRPQTLCSATTPGVSLLQPQASSPPRLPPRGPQGLPLALARALRQLHSPPHPSAAYRCLPPFPPPLRQHRPRPTSPSLPQPGPAPLSSAANGGAGGKLGSRRVCEGAVAVSLCSCSCCPSLQSSTAYPAWVPVTAILSAGEWEGGSFAGSGP